MSKKKTIFIVVGLLIIGAIVCGSVYYIYMYKAESKPDPGGSSYYAVFLADGQVYFGELLSKSRGEIVLTNPYYLQLNGADSQTVLSNSGFVIMKLEKQQHDPMNKLYINRDHVLYFEQLRKDSKLVESIINSQ